MDAEAGDMHAASAGVLAMADHSRSMIALLAESK